MNLIIILLRILAKRLQHHERNRIRRIQTQFRKAAAAAAAAAAAKEDPNLVAGTSKEGVKIDVKKECNEDEESSSFERIQGTSNDIRQNQNGTEDIGPTLFTPNEPTTIETNNATISVADDTIGTQAGQ